MVALHNTNYANLYVVIMELYFDLYACSLQVSGCGEGGGGGGDQAGYIHVS